MIKSLFDYQKFQRNEKLDSIIKESLSATEVDELSLDELEFVSAGISNPEYKKPGLGFESGLREK